MCRFAVDMSQQTHCKSYQLYDQLIQSPLPNVTHLYLHRYSRNRIAQLTISILIIQDGLSKSPALFTSCKWFISMNIFFSKPVCTAWPRSILPISCVSVVRGPELDDHLNMQCNYYAPTLQPLSVVKIQPIAQSPVTEPGQQLVDGIPNPLVHFL